MWLILCSAYDIPALWAYQGLKQLGLAPLELVTSELLASSLQWEHCLDTEGAHFTIHLADGRILKHDRILGTLNRILTISSEHLQLAHKTDRDYATQELNAFFMSWLYALPDPILNRPTSQGLSGYWRHASEWAWLAMRAGLPVPPYRQTSHNLAVQSDQCLVPSGTPTTTVFVVQNQVVGAVPEAIAQACRRLAKLANTELLGIELVTDPAQAWMFAGATPCPDFRLGGQALLNALAAALQGKWEEGE